jgi:hypothetical protein
VTVAAGNDSVDEDNETVTVAPDASSAYNVSSASGSASATILDDDLATVSISTALDASEYLAGFLMGTALVSREHNDPRDLTVSYSITGTATNGTDYTWLTGTVVIPAYMSEAAILINYERFAGGRLRRGRDPDAQYVDDQRRLGLLRLGDGRCHDGSDRG